MSSEARSYGSPECNVNSASRRPTSDRPFAHVAPCAPALRATGGGPMKRGITRRGRTFVLAAALALLVAWTAAPAGARPASEPRVEVQPVAWLAPDGGSMSFQVIASCPERWSVVE